MPKKRKLSSLDDKCRICLCDDGSMIDIFSDHLRLKIDDLGKSASIPIDDDEIFPRNICHVCLYKLDMWIDFKEQFVRSNAMLREHLELGELSDSKMTSEELCAVNLSRLLTQNVVQGSLAKRKHSESQVCSKDDSPEQGNTKKLKSDSHTPAAGAELNLKSEKQSESHEDQVVVIEDTLKAKEESDMTSDVIPVASEITQKVKQIVGRRAKTTERRKESTRRWVARKKALLAATGENDTDTDSMVSDDEQLSPVQKARAKCNAEKVAPESHRRMTRAVQNLILFQSNISGYYGTNNPDSESHVIQDSDTEVRKDRMNCTIKTETPADGGGDARLLSNNVTNVSPHRNNSVAENSKNSTNDADNLVPHSVRSELMIDGVTFVVTSTLVFSEPHYLNPAQTNNSLLQPSDEATQQERNTDIIDAVQLRRVSRKNSLSRSESKLVESCLNIEVEGTEVNSLQRVQTELSKFVEEGLKNKLTLYDEDDDDNDAAQSEKIDAKTNDAFKTLDQQLKTIVEKTIKKNLVDSSIIDNRGNNTFTGEFLKAALRSKIFQPRVHLVRYDPSCVGSLRQKSQKTRKSNVLQDIAKSSPKLLNKKTEEPTALPPPPPPPPLGKRRSVQPAKYADYNTSPFDSEGEEIATTSQVLKKPTTGPKSSKVKTYGPAAPKTVQTLVTANQHKAQQSLLLPQKPGHNEKSVANNSTSEKHICGVCGDSFGTRKEVETHFGTHKKQKMMRCKRCHEIVDARLVKSHVCSASKNLHKCPSCVATFRTEQLLARHAESHELEREAKIEEKISNAETPKSVQDTAISSKNITQNEKSDLQLVADSRESYTCFVCDKTFTDEELLKDHLQKHCDDMSEDERNNAKDYQCAICGESLDSEDALGTHVEKHLFDDEDDNPNLISIGDGGDVDKGSAKSSAEMLHSCGQCSENFDSEMLLMLHMQAHEEEVAIAEWERRGVNNAQQEQHVCVICSDIFATEDDLSEHLDIHNGTHICMLCDTVFLTLEDLQSHVNTH